MSWVTIIWSAIASACVTLALVHLLIWFKSHAAWASLVFALCALATSAHALCELWMMRSGTAGEFGLALRWLQVATLILILSLVGFVRLYMRAGRRWLAWTVGGVRTLSLILNFLFEPNLHFREMTGLRDLPFLGETISVGEGVPNPWMLVAHVSLLLLVIFVVDAALTVWRRGDPPRMRSLSGAIAFFVLAGSVQAVLVFWGVVRTPITSSLFFLGVVFSMGFELSRDVLSAGQLGSRLRESEARSSLAADSADAGLWSLDFTTNLFWSTDRARAILGFKPDEELRFDLFLDRVHPEDRDFVRRAVEDCVARRENMRLEYRVVVPDQGMRWIASRGRAYFSASGQAERLMGVSVDITERKIYEGTIKKSEEFNRTVLASLHNHIAILDRNGTIIAVNEAWKAFALDNSAPPLLAGCAVGVSYLNVCRQAAATGDESARQSLDGIQSVLDGSSASFGTEYACGSDSLSRWFEMRVLPFKRAEGGVLVSHTDITRRRELEAEAVQHRAELAHLSRVASLSELSGSLAHELNQPLAIILSNAQAAQRLLVREPPELAEVRDILKDIVSEDRRAGNVITRLRAMLKRGEPNRQALVLNDLILEALQLMRSDLIRRSVRLNLELGENLPMISGDRVPLEQVLLNLVTNACDAMAANPPGERSLTIASRLDGKTVRVSVSDTGSGLPADSGRIFEPFYTTKLHGLGMGLSICRTIVAAHGGRLWAEPNPGRGAVFHVALPITDY